MERLNYEEARAILRILRLMERIFNPERPAMANWAKAQRSDLEDNLEDLQKIALELSAS